MPLDDALQVGMIGDDRRNLDRQGADAIAVEKIVQAMVEFGNEDQHARLVVASCISQSIPNRSPMAAKSACKASIGRLTGADHENRAHEEAPGFVIAEMGGFGDEQAVPGQKSRDGGDDADGVGAGDRQDMVLRHRGPCTSRREREKDAPWTGGLVGSGRKGSARAQQSSVCGRSHSEAWLMNAFHDSIFSFT